MRICMVAAAVLLLIAGVVIGNALYIHGTVDRLTAAVETLPDTPDPATTPEAVAAIGRAVESRLGALGLSVNYTLLDRVQESIIQLEAYARAGDAWQYAATRALLRDQISDLARLEQLKAENLF